MSEGPLPYPWVGFDTSDSTPLPRAPRMRPHPLPPISRPRSNDSQSGSGNENNSPNSDNSSSGATSGSSNSCFSNPGGHYDLWSRDRTIWLEDQGLPGLASSCTSISGSDEDITPPKTPPSIYLDLEASTLAAEVALEVLKTEDLQECPLRVCPSGDNLQSPFKPVHTRPANSNTRTPLHASSTINALGLDLHGEDAPRTPTKRQRSLPSDDGHGRKRWQSGLYVYGDVEEDEQHSKLPMLSYQTANCRDLMMHFGLVPQSTGVASRREQPVRAGEQRQAPPQAPAISQITPPNGPTHYTRHPYPINPRLGGYYVSPTAAVEAQVYAQQQHASMHPQYTVQSQRPGYNTSANYTHYPAQQMPVQAPQVHHQPTYGWYNKRGGGGGGAYSQPPVARPEMAPTTFTFPNAPSPGARRRPHRHSHAPPHAPQNRPVA